MSPTTETMTRDEALAVLAGALPAKEEWGIETVAVPVAAIRAVVEHEEARESAARALAVEFAAARGETSVEVVRTGPGPCLLVGAEHRAPVSDHYTTSLDSVLTLAMSADRLGLGWAACGYEPAGDSDHEYRLTAWRALVSEVGPMAADRVNVAIRHDDAEDAA